MSQITIGGTTLNFKDSAFTGDQWEQVASWVLNGGAEDIDANAQIATEKAAAASASAAAARNSATSAGESASAAARSAARAEGYNSGAKSSASRAATSATNAASSERNAESYSATANGAKYDAESAATEAANSQSAAKQSEDNAAASATSAANSAASASDSATASAESIKHAPRINADGKWELWDATTNAYVATEYTAIGKDGTRWWTYAYLVANMSGNLLINKRYLSAAVVGDYVLGTKNDSGVVYTITGETESGDSWVVNRECILKGAAGTDGTTPHIGANGNWYIGSTDTGKPSKGADGSSIQSIERTSGTGAPGTTDTYTVTLTNGNTTTFQVYNGKDGSGSGDMAKAVYDPKGKAQDIFSYADTKYSKPSGGIPKKDLASDVQASLGKADSALQSYTETDPTVPAWAKAKTKPTYTASEVGALPANTRIPSTVAEMSDSGDYAKKSDLSSITNKVSKSGDTMTGKLTVPQVETGDGNSNYFQCRKFRGEGDANTYYHAIDFGYQNHDRVDFHEYGGLWSFYKNQTGKVNDGVLCGKITSNGWEGRAKLESGSTMVTSQLTENSNAIATTAFVHGLIDNVKHYSASNPPPYPVTSVNNKTGAVTLAKGDVGLGNVDNTSDANKPISNATQTALNGKQAKITASGLLKGNGSGGVTTATKGTDYAGTSKTVTATLLAASWTGSSAPYTYTLAVTGVTANSNQELLPALTITSEQLTALQAANIQDGGQAANSVTLTAFGDKPTIDLPIRVIVRGDS